MTMGAINELDRYITDLEDALDCASTNLDCHDKGEPAAMAEEAAQRLHESARICLVDAGAREPTDHDRLHQKGRVSDWLQSVDSSRTFLSGEGWVR